MDEIITLVHMSDHHFGGVLLNSSDTAEFKRSWHNVPLCVDLARCLKEHGLLDRLKNDPCCRLIVSGDLTASGTRDQFKIAKTVLHSSEVLGDFQFALGIPEHKALKVAGNHDNHGLSPLRKHNPAVSEHFERTPWFHPILSKGGKIQVEVFGIDSNSAFAGRTYLDLPFTRPHQFLSDGWEGGGFSVEEQKAFERSLESSFVPSKGVRRLRVIVCHHGITPKKRRNYTSEEWGGIRVAAQLDHESAAVLRRWAREYRIATVLTGHIHCHATKSHPCGFANPSERFWELCAPSAVQGPPDPKKHGFLVHTIAIKDDHLVWQLMPYEWGRDKEGRPGFRPNPQKGGILPGLVFD